MGAYVSYTSFDHKTMSIVPVIASFDAQGHVCPIYVRIERMAYKIETYYVVSRYSNVIEFRCRILDADCLKPITIIYYGNEQVWVMPVTGEGSV